MNIELLRIIDLIDASCFAFGFAKTAIVHFLKIHIVWFIIVSNACFQSYRKRCYTLLNPSTAFVIAFRITLHFLSSIHAKVKHEGKHVLKELIYFDFRGLVVFDPSLFRELKVE